MESIKSRSWKCTPQNTKCILHKIKALYCVEPIIFAHCYVIVADLSLFGTILFCGVLILRSIWKQTHLYTTNSVFYGLYVVLGNFVTYISGRCNFIQKMKNRVNFLSWTWKWHRSDVITICLLFQIISVPTTDTRIVTLVCTCHLKKVRD